MSYLLDTCAVSELIKKQPDRWVCSWIGGQSEEGLHLSVLTLGEVQKGISKLPDGTRRHELQQWLDLDLRQRFAGRILDVTPAVARHWGTCQGMAERAGRRMPVIDGLIAATALAHDLAVVTRNGEDMAVSGVRIVDPWTEGGGGLVHEI